MTRKRKEKIRLKKIDKHVKRQRKLFGQSIFLQMQRQQLSPKEVVDKLEITNEFFCEMLNGTVDIPFEILTRLERRLGFTIFNKAFFQNTAAPDARPDRGQLPQRFERY